MEVQQVALDGERVGPKRRTHTNIAHSVETFPIDSHARDVYAIRRNQLVVARQVDGRNGIALTEPAPASRVRENTERTPQQRPRAFHAPGGDQATNLAARHMMPAQQLFRICVYVEPHLAPELGQR